MSLHAQTVLHYFLLIKLSVQHAIQDIQLMDQLRHVMLVMQLQIVCHVVTIQVLLRIFLVLGVQVHSLHRLVDRVV